MKKVKYTGILGSALMALILTACGSDGGGSTVTIKGTALNNKTVVAAAPRSKAVEFVWNLISAKEAVAQQACDADKLFLLAGTGETVCLTRAVVAFDEIELEQEGVTDGLEIELGPFVLDLLGDSTDNIPGSMTITESETSFDKIKFKVDDLDDGGDNTLDNNGLGDDTPINTSGSDAMTAGLLKKSIIIEGTADNGTTTETFKFDSNIEARIIVNFTTATLAQNSLIIYFDLGTAFGSLSFTDIVDAGGTLDGSMSSSGSKNTSCSVTGLTPSQQLACNIVKNIDLYEDVDGDDSADDSEGEHRGDDRGAGGFDDDFNHD